MLYHKLPPLPNEEIVAIILKHQRIPALPKKKKKNLMPKPPRTTTTKFSKGLGSTMDLQQTNQS
jgi:hypothetical protein